MVFPIALFCHNAIATEPIIRQQAPPPDDLQVVLAMNGEISGGEITIRDLQEMFLDEYGLHLRSTEGLYVGIAGNRLKARGQRVRKTVSPYQKTMKGNCVEAAPFHCWW